MISTKYLNRYHFLQVFTNCIIYRIKSFVWYTIFEFFSYYREIVICIRRIFPSVALVIFDIVIGVLDRLAGHSIKDHFHAREGVFQLFQETDDFTTVGIKAYDDYTLEYTLTQPTPFFLSMLDYVSFMPVYGPFLAEKGADFGLATGNDTILYCGAYVLSEFAPQERRVLSKNTEYWDAENVFIDKLSFTYNAEASTISPEMYLRGEVDSASISTTIAKEWLNDPEKADSGYQKPRTIWRSVSVRLIPITLFMSRSLVKVIRRHLKTANTRLPLVFQLMMS